MHRMGLSQHKRLTIGLLLACATVILVAAGIWYDSSRSIAPAPANGSTSALTSPAFTVPPAMRNVRLAVLSDTPLPSEHTGQPTWPRLLAKQNNWFLNEVSSPATGYAAGGQASFPDRLAGIGQSSPDVIVIAGGSADAADPGAVRGRAIQLYDAIARELPGALVVVVGPIWNLSTAPLAVVAVNEEIRAAAEAAGIRFVNALSWVPDPSWVSQDGTITDNGQKFVADRIGENLPAMPALLPAT